MGTDPDGFQIIPHTVAGNQVYIPRWHEYFMLSCFFSFNNVFASCQKGCLTGLRIPKQLFCRFDRKHSAAVHNADPVAHTEGFITVVGHHQDPFAILFKQIF